MADRIPLGGMKFSEELALAVLSDDTPPRGVEVDVLRALAGRQINMFYLSLSRSAGRTRVCLCVAPDRLQAVEQLAAAKGLWTFRSVRSVGLLTFYPHERRIEALMRALQVFAGSGLPVFGVASTLSALTFVTAFEALDRASERLGQVFKLPENHAPFKPEFRVKPVAR